MKVNGTYTELTGPVTVAGLIAEKKFAEDRIAVELNGRIVPRSEYSKTMLKDDDSVEIVGFVGGG